jgi:RNA polymerase sigma factor (sigma-70 family)
MLPTDEALRPLSPEAERALVENHHRFLGYVQRKVGSRALAEELLHSALVRVLERGSTALEEDGVVNWFARVLQNLLTDHFRRGAAEARALEREAGSADEPTDDPELRQVVCTCMHDLLPTLKPEYAEMVRRVDLEEHPVSAVAQEVGISSNNAAVRLHRARHALKVQLERTCGACAAHGCLDCSCRARPRVDRG